nr:MAG TPA: hypothetical protein [Caudoviricetes sp.]
MLTLPMKIRLDIRLVNLIVMNFGNICVSYQRNTQF